MSGSAFAVTHHAFSSGAGRTSDGNGSHASTLKSPSYTKSVSWQHYLMSHTYSHLYNLPTTGLRFFTVYGPWGRPDMALFKFTKAMIEGKSIDVYNYGKMKRDFTYIDDIAEAIIRLQDVIPQADADWTVETGSPATSSAPYRVYNIGNSSPVELMDYITALEEALGKEAEKNMMPIQPGDVLETSADTKALYDVIGFKPQISVKDGVKNFVDWYRAFYKV
ncbi:hypothetical protein SK81_01987 [Escherichia coli]|nr:hypothetical protein SK81_01987 [Escherichia coli]